MTFDWPCHGTDVRKELCLNDCNEYLKTVLDFVKRHYNQSRLLLNATSFGGYLSLKYIYQNENPFDKIVLRSPAINMYEILYNTILFDEDREKLSKGKSVLSGFERKVKITPSFINELATNDIQKWDYQQYSNDMLIMHGDQDEVVSIEKVKNFADNNSIEFIEIYGADHMFKRIETVHEAISYFDEFCFGEVNKIQNSIK